MFLFRRLKKSHKQKYEQKYELVTSSYLELLIAAKNQGILAILRPIPPNFFIRDFHLSLKNFLRVLFSLGLRWTLNLVFHPPPPQTFLHEGEVLGIQNFVYDLHRSGTAKKSFLSTLSTKYIFSTFKYNFRPKLSTFAIMLIYIKLWILSCITGILKTI